MTTLALHPCITGPKTENGHFDKGPKTAKELAVSCNIDTGAKIPDTARRRRYYDSDLFAMLKEPLRKSILETCGSLVKIDRAVHDDTRKNSLSGEEIHSYAYGEIDTRVFRFPYHLCTGLVVMLENPPPPVPVAPPPEPLQPEIMREVILKRDEPVASSMPHFYASMAAERERRNLVLGAVAFAGAAAFTLFAIYLRRYPRFRLMLDLGDSFRRIFRMRGREAGMVAQGFQLKRGFWKTRLTLQPGQVVPFREWLAANGGTPRQLAKVDRVIADHGLAPPVPLVKKAPPAPMHPTPPPAPPAATPAPEGRALVVADADIEIVGPLPSAAPPPPPGRPVIPDPTRPPEPPTERLTKVFGGRPDGRVPVELREGRAPRQGATPPPEDADLPVVADNLPVAVDLPPSSPPAVVATPPATKPPAPPAAEAAPKGGTPGVDPVAERMVDDGFADLFGPTPEAAPVSGATVPRPPTPSPRPATPPPPPPGREPTLDEILSAVDLNAELEARMGLRPPAADAGNTVVARRRPGGPAAGDVEVTVAGRRMPLTQATFERHRTTLRTTIERLTSTGMFHAGNEEAVRAHRDLARLVEAARGAVGLVDVPLLPGMEVRMNLQVHRLVVTSTSLTRLPQKFVIGEGRGEMKPAMAREAMDEIVEAIRTLDPVDEEILRKLWSALSSFHGIG